MSKERNELLEMPDLYKLMLDTLRADVVSYEYEFDNWYITGRRGKRTMEYTGTLVLGVRDKDTGDVEKYRLSERRETFSEDGCLTVMLPKRALTLISQ